MKTLRIVNGNPEYLDCSIFGSYYLPCRIIKRNKNSVRIEFENERVETEQKTVHNREIEVVERYYEQYGMNYREELRAFLSDVKNGDIPLDKATEIILNDGEIKL